MSERHVVVGAGPVGQSTATLLAERGHDVVLVSRSGAGPELAGVRREAADVADTERMVALAGADGGAAAIYNCVNPPSYDIWPTWWPPVAEAFLLAAERTGATLVTAAALYPYGPVDGPMVESMPDSATDSKGRLRAEMWAEAKSRHDAGRIHAVEVRGSDYVGPIVTNAHIPTVMPKALQGTTVRVFGASDLLHSMTDVRDMARALVAVATTPSAWGRVWHAPTNPARTQAETVADVCRAVGREPGKVKVWPGAMLSLGGVFVPFLKQMRESVYMFDRPYVLDSSAIERELGLAPTPWDDVCRATAQTAQTAQP